MRHLIALFTLAACIGIVAGAARGQSQDFPTIPLPAGIAATVAYNQLGTPRITGGLWAIYPVSESLKLYGTTGVDFYPKLAYDPTGKKFYAIDANVRQEFHRDLFDTGRFSFLFGLGAGPALSQGQPSGFSVSLNSDFVATFLVQVTPAVSFILPVRMLYVSNAGWNPVAQVGFIVNLKKLPAAKPLAFLFRKRSYSAAD